MRTRTVTSSDESGGFGSSVGRLNATGTVVGCSVHACLSGSGVLSSVGIAIVFVVVVSLVTLGSGGDKRGAGAEEKDEGADVLHCGGGERVSKKGMKLKLKIVEIKTGRPASKRSEVEKGAQL